MKKIVFLALGILFTADADVIISVDNFQDNEDGTATMDIFMQSTEPVAAFQFNMINGNAEYDSGESYYDYGSDGRSKTYEKYGTENDYFNYNGCYGCTVENDLNGDGQTSKFECLEVCNGASSCCVASVGGSVLGQDSQSECYSSSNIWAQWWPWGGECLDEDGDVVWGYCRDNTTSDVLFSFQTPQDCYVNGHTWEWIDYEYQCREIGICSDKNTNYSGICYFDSSNAACTDALDGFSVDGYCALYLNDQSLCDQNSGQWVPFSGYVSDDNICELRGECLGADVNNLNNWGGGDIADDAFSEFDNSSTDVLHYNECDCLYTSTGTTGNAWSSLDLDWYGVYSWNPYSVPGECFDAGKVWQYKNPDPSNDNFQYECSTFSSGSLYDVEGACYTDDSFSELMEPFCVNQTTGSPIDEGVDESCCSNLSATWKECQSDRNTCTDASNGCGGVWVQIGQVSGDPTVDGIWDPDCPACNMPSDVPVTSCSNIDQSATDLDDCMQVCEDAEGQWLGGTSGTETNDVYDKGEVFVDSPIIELGFGDEDAGDIIPSDWGFSLGGDVILAYSLQATTIDAQENPALLMSLTFDYSPDNIDSDKIFVYSDDICKAPGQTGAGNCLSELAFSDVNAERLSTYFEPSVIDVASGAMSSSQCGDGICSPKYSCYDGDDVQTGFKDFSDCIDSGYTWENDENVDSCSDDCSSYCGDGFCDPSDEDYGTCGSDCLPSCGDGVCSANVVTENGPENVDTCPSDCSLSFCGDHYCDSDEDEDTCSTDCYSICGDGTCDSGENYGNCSADCENQCEDFYCSAEEEAGTLAHASCDADGDGVYEGNALDCSCGDDICDQDALGENYLNCPLDCDSECGDGLYDYSTDDGNDVVEISNTIDCLADYSVVCGDSYCDQRCSVGGQCVDASDELVIVDDEELDYTSCKSYAFFTDPTVSWSVEHDNYADCAAAGGLWLSDENYDTCSSDCGSICGDGFCDRDGGEDFETCSVTLPNSTTMECESICGDGICDSSFINYVCYQPGDNCQGYIETTLTEEECLAQESADESCPYFWGPVENSGSCSMASEYCIVDDNVVASINSEDECSLVAGDWLSGDCGVVCGDFYCDLAGGEMYTDETGNTECSDQLFYCIDDDGTSVAASSDAECTAANGNWVSGDCSLAENGDGICNTEAGEDYTNSQLDCSSACGDGICLVSVGESSDTCAQSNFYCYIEITQTNTDASTESECSDDGGLWTAGDCYCGDGVCDDAEKNLDKDGDGVLDDDFCADDMSCWDVAGDGLCVSLDGDGETPPYCSNNLTESQCGSAPGGVWVDNDSSCHFVSETDCANVANYCTGDGCAGVWDIGSAGDCVIAGDGVCSQIDVDNGVLQGEAEVADLDAGYFESADCYCGNGSEDEGESIETCLEDFAWCGDGVCSSSVGEKSSNCADCSCGDGVCDQDEGFGLVIAYCSNDCCGDGEESYYETSNPEECSEDLSIEMTAPIVYSLESNYPNPFNPITNIRYSVASPGNVKVTIYDSLGRLVHQLVDGYHSTGVMYEVQWDADNQSRIPVSTGIYFYEMVSGDYVERKKMTIIK